MGAWALFPGVLRALDPPLLCDSILSPAASGTTCGLRLARGCDQLQGGDGRLKIVQGLIGQGGREGEALVLSIMALAMASAVVLRELPVNTRTVASAAERCGGDLGRRILESTLCWGLRARAVTRGCRAVLHGRKKCSLTQFSPKGPRAHHVLVVGGGRLAVGDWRLVVGGGWWLGIGG